MIKDPKDDQATVVPKPTARSTEFERTLRPKDSKCKAIQRNLSLISCFRDMKVKDSRPMTRAIYLSHPARHGIIASPCQFEHGHRKA